MKIGMKPQKSACNTHTTVNSIHTIFPYSSETYSREKWTPFHEICSSLSIPCSPLEMEGIVTTAVIIKRFQCYNPRLFALSIVNALQINENSQAAYPLSTNAMKLNHRMSMKRDHSEDEMEINTCENDTNLSVDVECLFSMPEMITYISIFSVDDLLIHASSIWDGHIGPHPFQSPSERNTSNPTLVNLML